MTKGGSMEKRDLGPSLGKKLRKAAFPNTRRAPATAQPRITSATRLAHLCFVGVLIIHVFSSFTTPLLSTPPIFLNSPDHFHSFSASLRITDHSQFKPPLVFLSSQVAPFCRLPLPFPHPQIFRYIDLSCAPYRYSAEVI